MFFRNRGHRPPSAKLRLFSPAFLNRRDRTDNEARIRALCANAFVGDSTAVCRVLGRYKMYVDTLDVGLSVHLVMDGYWEMWLTEIIAETVKPGMLAIDIGANLGYFSVLMADLVGSSGNVHAFEPNAALVQRLNYTARANGFDRTLHVHPFGLGDVDGALYRFIIPEDDPKNGFIVPAEAGLSADTPGLIATRRLDSFPELLDADVLKIDADTAERKIWKGMRGIFDRNRSMTIFLEFNNERYENPQDFLSEIVAEGFSLAKVDLEDGIIACTARDVLADTTSEDQMLVIRR